MIPEIDKNKFKEFLNAKPSKCKHCQPINCGVAGAHYMCCNENSKKYGMRPCLCFDDCDGYEE